MPRGGCETSCLHCMHAIQCKYVEQWVPILPGATLGWWNLIRILVYDSE